MTNGKKAKPPTGFALYKLVSKLRHPGVVRLTERAYSHDPLKAWETTLGLGTKRTGVVSKIREKKRRTGGVSGLF